MNRVTAGSTGKPPLEFETVKSCEFEPLVALSRSVFGFLPDGFSASYFRWLYIDNPQGTPVIGNAMCQGNLVGHYALLPVRAWLEGRERIVGLGVNALTRREFQGRAVFARLAALVEKAALREGISSAYVAPSPQSKLWFLNLLRFSEWSPLPLWVRPLRFEPILSSLGLWGRRTSSVGRLGDVLLVPALRLAAARRNPRHLEIREVDDFGAEFETLWEREKKRFRFVISRTYEHLRWRFNAAPTRHYRIWGAYSQGQLVSYVVARVRQLERFSGLRVGVIADLFGSSDEIGLNGSRLLVAQVLRWLSQKDVGLCMMQLVSPAFESALRANGFFRVPEFFAERRALLFRCFDAAPRPGIASSEIHFAGGDHDMG